MAPGCLSVNIHQQESWTPSNESSSFANNQLYLDQIPLPSTPPPPAIMQKPILQKKTPAAISPLTKSSKSSIDTIDSFEVLEQTVIKQKKLSRKKNNDMRVKVLLKRTFDLICEIMDHENGFDTPAAPEATKITEQPQSTCQDSIDDSQILEINIHQNDYEDETDASVTTTTNDESSFLECDDRLPSIETLKNMDSNPLEANYIQFKYVENEPADNKKRKCDSDFDENDDFDSFCDKKRKYSFDDDDIADENETQKQLSPNNSTSTPMFHNLTNVKHDSSFKRRFYDSNANQYRSHFDCRLESHLYQQKQIIINFQTNSEL